MAWGRSLSEDVIHDPTTGVRLNDNLCDYKYSLMCDSAIPTTLAEEIVKDVGPYGNVGAGEPTSVAALALLNTAVCNAVGANMPNSPVLPAIFLRRARKARGNICVAFAISAKIQDTPAKLRIASRRPAPGSDLLAP